MTEFHDTTLTPENAKLLEESSASSEPCTLNGSNITDLPMNTTEEQSTETRQMETSITEQPLPLLCLPVELVKSKSPPPTAKKPSAKHSPIRKSTNQNIESDSSSDVGHRVENTDTASNEFVKPSSSTHNVTPPGMPSVADRIKVCYSSLHR